MRQSGKNRSEDYIPPPTFDDPVAIRIRAAEDSLGTNPLVEWASRLLDGRAQPGDEGDPDITVLGGMEAIEDFMARVWAAQALEHVWHRTAEPSVKAGLADEAWQVRATSTRVVAIHQLTSLEPDVEQLLADAHPQVRSAAARALGEVATPQQESAITALNSVVMDPDSALADAAETALNRIAERFDREDLRPSPRY